MGTTTLDRALKLSRRVVALVACAAGLTSSCGCSCTCGAPALEMDSLCPVGTRRRAPVLCDGDPSNVVSCGCPVPDGTALCSEGPRDSPVSVGGGGPTGVRGAKTPTNRGAGLPTPPRLGSGGDMLGDMLGENDEASPVPPDASRKDVRSGGSLPRLRWLDCRILLDSVNARAPWGTCSRPRGARPGADGATTWVVAAALLSDAMARRGDVVRCGPACGLVSVDGYPAVAPVPGRLPG